MNPLIKKGSELNLKIDSLSYGGKGISRYEGIEAHARTGDARLRKYGYSNK